ncbi:hypothetical protein V6N13_085180 [Hibiscus sabdariffa]
MIIFFLQSLESISGKLRSLTVMLSDEPCLTNLIHRFANTSTVEVHKMAQTLPQMTKTNRLVRRKQQKAMSEPWPLFSSFLTFPTISDNTGFELQGSDDEDERPDDAINEDLDNDEDERPDDVINDDEDERPDAVIIDDEDERPDAVIIDDDDEDELFGKQDETFEEILLVV